MGSRRVDDVKVEKDLMGCQIWATVVTMAWVATMASMASMVWMAQGSTDVEVPLVPMRSIQIHWKCRRSIGIFPRKHWLVTSCSKPWKLETVFEMWKEPSIDGPGCLGDPCASVLTGTNAGATWSARERSERWHRAGYGWLDSFGSGYGRRRGCGGIPEDVWFCVTCRMVPCRCGVEVLSWNVSGNEFLSQSSLLETGVLKLEMTDFFHLGELIPRLKTKKGANEPMRARAMHMMVIKTLMNPNTELVFCTALVSQLCQVPSRYNCVNVGLKLLEK